MTTGPISCNAEGAPAIEVMPKPATEVGAPSRLRRPIFISGLRKSGTSMTKELFDGHPDLYVIPPNELHFFRFTDHPSAIKDKDKSLSSDMDIVKQRLCDHKFIDQMRRAKHYRKNIDMEMFDRLVAGQTARTAADVYRIIYTSLARASRFVTRDVSEFRYVSKTVNETEYMPELMSWFPDMKMIYVLRNPYGHFNAARWSMRSRGRVLPRKGAFSLWKDPYPYLGAAIARMKLSYYFMRRYTKLYPENFYVMVYDRLLLDPEGEMRKMCDFLDIEFDECLLRTTSCGVDRQKPGWTCKDRATSSIDPGPVTKWKEQISPVEIRLLNDYFRDVFEEFGFEMLPSRASRFRLMSLAERPTTYVLNRMLFAPRVRQSWR